ncbi:hypothetical protein JCM8202_002765 [Rhodotorula sphaerocarpa]
MSRGLSPRTIALAALCLQSTALGILVHANHAAHRPERSAPRSSSLILTTELLKLGLLLFLATLEAMRERRLDVRLLPQHRFQPSAEPPAEGAPHRERVPSRAIRIPPPPSGPSSNAVRQAGHQNRPSLEVSLDAPLTPLSDLLPIQAQYAPLATRPDVPEKLVPKPDEPEEELGSPELAWARRRELGLARALVEEIFGPDWWIMAVPAVLFAIQNNLLYVAARTLSVPVFQVLLQLRPPITAVCVVFMLGRRITVLQWVALVVLGLGTVCMHVGGAHVKSSRQHGLLHYGLSTGLDAEYATGLAAAIISCFAGAVASTYFEFIVKRPRRLPLGLRGQTPADRDAIPERESIWIRAIQISLFGCFIGLCATLLQGDHAHLDSISGVALGLRNLHDPLQPWYSPITSLGGGFFDGFSSSTWMIVASQASTGVAIAAAIQHADILVKDFTLAVSMVLAFAFALLVDGQPAPTTSYLGAAAIVLAALAFRNAGASPPFRVQIDRSRVFLAALIVLLVIWMSALAADGLASETIPVRKGGNATHSSLDRPLARQKPFVVQPSGGFVLEASERLDRRPTVAVVDMTMVNEPLGAAASGACGLGARAYRELTWAPFGFPVNVPPDYPYWVMKTDQYALDDILSIKFATYERAVPLLSSPPPEFLFLPLFSEIWANPWGCKREELASAAARVTQFIRDLAKSAGDTPYPPIILPLATIRSKFDSVFTPDVMAELKDKVILVSIENAPHQHAEGFRYLIDVPYPTAFHLSERVPGRKMELHDFFLNMPRRYLIHYGAGQTHPWGQSSKDPFNGFALRAKIGAELKAFEAEQGQNETAPKIVWDDITNSVEKAENLSPIHAHMEQSIFCLMPAGDSPSRRAFYEAVQLGCIPVIFREKSYGRLFPTSPELNDLSRYTVLIDETDYLAGGGPSLIEQLQDISLGEIRAKQEHLYKIAHRTQWALPEQDEWLPSTNPRGAVPIAGLEVWNRTVARERDRNSNATEDAFAMLLRELAAIRDGTWQPGEAFDLRRGESRDGIFKVARRLMARLGPGA